MPRSVAVGGRGPAATAQRWEDEGRRLRRSGGRTRAGGYGAAVGGRGPAATAQRWEDEGRRLPRSRDGHAQPWRSGRSQGQARRQRDGGAQVVDARPPVV